MEQRAKKPQRLPAVPTRGEVRALLAQMQGASWLMAAVVYGGALRLMECLRLRVKDIDFEYRQLLIRDAKGQKIASGCCRKICSNRYATISPAAEPSQLRTQSQQFDRETAGLGSRPGSIDRKPPREIDVPSFN